MHKIPRLSRDVAILNRVTSITDSKKFKCFCCEDTGYVVGTLIKLVIPDYNLLTDKIPVCSRAGCLSQDKVGNFYHQQDVRFTPEVCEMLDIEGRAYWMKLDEDKQKELNANLDSLTKEV